MAIETLTKIICEYFGITVEDIKGRSRVQSLSGPRKIACYMIKELIPISFEDIGTFMGLRDHSTVMYYVRDVKKKLENEPMWKMHTMAIRTLIEESYHAQVTQIQSQPVVELDAPTDVAS